MMRVLGLLRQEIGGMATQADLLADALDAEGIELVVDRCAAWMPESTGWFNNRETKRRTRAALRGFDAALAFGYRPAWALADAVGVHLPWLYLAQDMPRTTAAPLIDRLNMARVGLCSGRGVLAELKDGQAMHLKILSLGAAEPPELDRAACRERLRLDPDDLVILVSGAADEEGGADAVLQALPEALATLPGLRLVLALWNDLPPEMETLVRRCPDRVTSIGRRNDLNLWRAASDLVVVPRRRGGFSCSAVEAMSQGVPVLIRSLPGFDEIGSDGDSLFAFQDDDELPGRLTSILGRADLLEAVGRSGRSRWESRHRIESSALALGNILRDVVA